MIAMFLKLASLMWLESQLIELEMRYNNFFQHLERCLVLVIKRIDTFMKSTHNSFNNARATNAIILIPSTVTLALKGILFELKDNKSV